MRKRIITAAQQGQTHSEMDWLNLEGLAEVEITSEDVNHPIESALLLDRQGEWRAVTPGKQVIRLVFTSPQTLRHIRLKFVECSVERTQEFVLRWLPENGGAWREILRQQWNFSPLGSTIEEEDLQVELPSVKILEVAITPDISGGNAIASLALLRLAGS